MGMLYWVEYVKRDIYGQAVPPFRSKSLVDKDGLDSMLLDSCTTVKKILRVKTKDETEIYVGTEEAEMVRSVLLDIANAKPDTSEEGK